MHSKALSPFKDTRNQFQKKFDNFKVWMYYDVMPSWARSRCYGLSMWWYEQVSSRLNPRQKWLTKTIGRTWTDKSTLVPQILFECIIHFVEEEKCFEKINWAQSFEGGEEFAAKIKEIYDWAKTGRTAFEKRIENAYPDVKIEFVPCPDKADFFEMKKVGENANKSYEELYGEVNRLEKELNDKDTAYLTWIVVNREYLWA